MQHCRIFYSFLIFYCNFTCLNTWKYRSGPPEVFCKKGVPKSFAKFTGKHQYQFLFFNKKETLARMFSSEFCKTSQVTFFNEHLRETLSLALLTNILLVSDILLFVHSAKGSWNKSQNMRLLKYLQYCTWDHAITS